MKPPPAVDRKPATPKKKPAAKAREDIGSPDGALDRRPDMTHPFHRESFTALLSLAAKNRKKR